MGSTWEFVSNTPGAGACAVPDSFARTVPGPGSYFVERWHHEQAAASGSAFVSRVPRSPGTRTTDAPSPTHYQKLATWGASGRAHAMGPRVQLRLARTNSQRGAEHAASADSTAARSARKPAPASIPDRSWHGFNAWQSAPAARRGDAHGPGAGQYSPCFDMVHPRPVSVDFGKRPSRDTQRGPRPAADADAELTVKPSGVAIKHPMPTFKRPTRTHTRREPAPDAPDGGGGPRREAAQPAPRVVYDLRGKLSRPIPPFPAR